MTIQEAIKSGRKYKRKSWDFWHDAKSPFVYNMEDILADDWEIEREPREIWGFRYNDGRLASCFKDSKDELLFFYPYVTGTAIKFREVIE